MVLVHCIYICWKIQISTEAGIYIMAIPPPSWGGGLLSKLKYREEFERGLHEKRKGKVGKEEKRKE